MLWKADLLRPMAKARSAVSAERTGLGGVDKPLSTNARRRASIMAMNLRPILVVILSSAAIVCPMLCANSPSSHDSSHGPCSPADSDDSSGHDRTCDNSCFCSSATTQQNSPRSLIENGFTFAAFIDAAACQSSSLPEPAPCLLAKILRPASAVERALPLLI